MIKIAKLYMRYSSHAQNEQSIEGQRTVCMEFAEKNGYTVTGEYIDRAISGKTDQRDAFQQMLADSEKRQFQYVIVYKGDRFARNRIESAINKKRLKDNGVKVVSATENIPDTPEGIILESLMEGLSEYYSAELAQKVRRGMLETNKKGQVSCKAPFGYIIVDKKFQPDPVRAPIVKRVFQEYGRGVTAPAIAKALKEEGVTNKEGKPLTSDYLYKLLRNPKYAGHGTYAGTEFPDICPAIVTDDEFQTVQEILNKNKLHVQPNRSSLFLLSGKCFCGLCKSPVNGDSGTSATGTTYYYYKCSEKKKTAKKCPLCAIKKDYLEQTVFSSCVEVLQGGFIQQIIDRAFELRQIQIANDSKVKELEHVYTEAQKKFDNYMEAIGRGLFAGITNDVLLKAQADVEIAKQNLQDERRRVEAFATKDDYAVFLNRFLERQIDNPEFYKEVIVLLVSRIYVYDDKIVVEFRLSDKEKPNRQQEIPVDSSAHPRLVTHRGVHSNYSIVVDVSAWYLIIDRKRRNS